MTTWRNHYECPDCGTVWEDEWSCQCNDRCPTCRCEVEPFLSEDITESEVIPDLQGP